MRMGWKVFFPMSRGWLLVTANLRRVTEALV
jgi:NADH:ubiquinone oxidoreductase subunit H